MALHLSDVLQALEARYPQAWAQEWDSVGLQVGDPADRVSKIFFTVDVTERVVDEALAWGADLIVSHHPMFFRGTTTVATTHDKGAIAHRLIKAGCALYVAHTNADVAAPGVNDALAAAVGLTNTAPLLAGVAPGIGHGRIGTLAAPARLSEFAQAVAKALPLTHHGVRVSGDLNSIVTRVAVCGGSGADFLGAAAAAGADVFVTADLKHHVTQEFRDHSNTAVVDVAHWASEWPWLNQAAELLRSDLGERGTSVEVHVSTMVTDPWTAHFSGGNA